MRTQIQVRGIVQGVGFRPFVYSLAQKHALKGRVYNNGSGVLIDAEGAPEKIDRFIVELQSNAPSLSQVESLRRIEISEPALFGLSHRRKRDRRVKDSFPSRPMSRLATTACMSCSTRPIGVTAIPSSRNQSNFHR